eukprot:scaffold15771_cov27-Tisochrysis_lutea.AAC.2
MTQATAARPKSPLPLVTCCGSSEVYMALSTFVSFVLRIPWTQPVKPDAPTATTCPWRESDGWRASIAASAEHTQHKARIEAASSPSESSAADPSRAAVPPAVSAELSGGPLMAGLLWHFSQRICLQPDTDDCP